MINIEKAIQQNIFYFLKETFGGYTNTPGNDHPNKEGHEIWANLLSNKLEELNYIKTKLI